ncbi:MAG: nuclear transport factor 2 family protein [Pseudomonadota bacterium]
MHFRAAILAGCVATLVPALGMANSAETKAFVLEALQNTLLAGDVDAVDRYFAEDYIQHNPMFADGVEGQKAVVGFLSATEGFKAEYVRVIADDDIVAIHARYEGFGPTATIGFDVFRVEDGKIVEHWDNLIAETPPNPSGHTQIDGATEITDLDKTEANKATVTDFITRSLINQEDIDITQYISPVTYIQHNPMVADGLEGFGAFMAEMAAQGMTMEYSVLHRVIGEGNFVLTMSEGTLGGQPQAFYDLFRLDDGLIVEHWDVIAPMPGPDAPHNGSGKF